MVYRSSDSTKLKELITVMNHPRQSSTTVACLVTVVLLCCKSSSHAGDKFVNVVYFSEPDLVLPADIEKIEVQKPNYVHREADDGVMRDLQHRWYRMYIAGLEKAFRESGRPLLIVEREDRKNLLRLEQDRLYDGGDPDEVQEKQHAQAVIVPRFRLDWTMQDYCVPVPVEERVAKSVGKRALGSIPIVGWVAGSAIDNPSARIRTAILVSIGCDAKLSLPGRSQIASYNGNLEDRDITVPTTWGSGHGGKLLHQLEPVQAIISRLIEEHARNFASLLVPVRHQLHFELKRPSDQVEVAVDYLNAGNLERARLIAWEAWTDSESDDHTAACVLGVISQVEGDWVSAIAWYGRAKNLKPKNEEYRRLHRKAEVRNDNSRGTPIDRSDTRE